MANKQHQAHQEQYVALKRAQLLSALAGLTESNAPEGWEESSEAQMLQFLFHRRLYPTATFNRVSYEAFELGLMNLTEEQRLLIEKTIKLNNWKTASGTTLFALDLLVSAILNIDLDLPKNWERVQHVLVPLGVQKSFGTSNPYRIAAALSQISNPETLISFCRMPRGRERNVLYTENLQAKITEFYDALFNRNFNEPGYPKQMPNGLTEEQWQQIEDLFGVLRAAGQTNPELTRFIHLPKLSDKKITSRILQSRQATIRALRSLKAKEALLFLNSYCRPNSPYIHRRSFGLSDRQQFEWETKEDEQSYDVLLRIAGATLDVPKLSASTTSKDQMPLHIIEEAKKWPDVDLNTTPTLESLAEQRLGFVKAPKSVVAKIETLLAAIDVEEPRWLKDLEPTTQAPPSYNPDHLLAFEAMDLIRMIVRRDPELTEGSINSRLVERLWTNGLLDCSFDPTDELVKILDLEKASISPEFELIDIETAIAAEKKKLHALQKRFVRAITNRAEINEAIRNLFWLTHLKIRYEQLATTRRRLKNHDNSFTNVTIEQAGEDENKTVRVRLSTTGERLVLTTQQFENQPDFKTWSIEDAIRVDNAKTEHRDNPFASLSSEQRLENLHTFSEADPSVRLDSLATASTAKGASLARVSDRFEYLFSDTKLFANKSYFLAMLVGLNLEHKIDDLLTLLRPEGIANSDEIELELLNEADADEWNVHKHELEDYDLSPFMFTYLRRRTSDLEQIKQATERIAEIRSIVGRHIDNDAAKAFATFISVVPNAISTWDTIINQIKTLKSKPVKTLLPELEIGTHLYRKKQLLDCAWILVALDYLEGENRFEDQLLFGIGDSNGLDMPYRNWKYEILADELMVSVNWIKANGIPTDAIPAHHIAEAIDQIEKAFFYSTLLIGDEGKEADVIHGIRANLRGAVHRNSAKFVSSPYGRKWRHFTRFDHLRFREILKIEYSPDILAKLRTPYPEHVQFTNFPFEIKVSFNADFETERAWIEWCNQTSDTLSIYAGAPAAIRRGAEFGQMCLTDQATIVLQQEPSKLIQTNQQIPANHSGILGQLEPDLEAMIAEATVAALNQIKLIQDNRFEEHKPNEKIFLFDTSEYPKIKIYSSPAQWPNNTNPNPVILRSIISTIQTVLSCSSSAIQIELVNPFESRLLIMLLEDFANNPKIVKHLVNGSLSIPQLYGDDLPPEAVSYLIDSVESYQASNPMAVQPNSLEAERNLRIR